MSFRCPACLRPFSKESGLRSHLLQRDDCFAVEEENRRRQRQQARERQAARDATAQGRPPEDEEPTVVDNEYIDGHYDSDDSDVSNIEEVYVQNGNPNIDLEYNYTGDWIEEPGSSSDEDVQSFDSVSDDEIGLNAGMDTALSVTCSVAEVTLGDEPVPDVDGVPVLDGSFRPGTAFYCDTLDRGIPSTAVSKQFKDSLGLIKTLRNEKVPLNTYEKIREWHRTTAHGASTELYTRKALFTEIYRMFPHLPKHSIVDVTMNTGRAKAPRMEKFPVITVDVWKQVYMKLNNPVLMAAENCVLDPSNPYGKYMPKQYLDDIQDGRAFNDKCAQLRQDPDWDDATDFPIGLIAYCDKTFTDVLGRYNLEPVVMTFSFLNRKARSNPRSWIICGFITQTGFTSAQQNALQKGVQSKFFHEQMRIIHKPFHDHNSRAWTQLRLCGVREIRRTVFFLLSICGDGPGSDAVCARYMSYGPGTRRVAWKCMCANTDINLFFGEDIDDDELLSRCLCQWVDAPEIREVVRLAYSPDKAVRKQALEDLKELSTHPTKLFTDDTNILLAATEKEGLYSLCYTCVLHCVYQGLVPRTIETILVRLTNFSKEAVDTWARKSLFQRNHQSGMQKMFHRTTFKSMCEITKMSGKEKMGHLFCWMILIRSGIGSTILTRSRYGRLSEKQLFSHYDEESYLYFMHENHLTTFGRIFEMILTFDRHIMVPGPHLWDANGPPEEVTAAENKLYRRISSMMRTIMWILPKPKELPVDKDGNRRAVVRKRDRITTKKKGIDGDKDNPAPEEVFADAGPPLDVGDGDGEVGVVEERAALHPIEDDENHNEKLWTFQKIHLTTHLPREMTRIGVMANVDTSSGESNHKFWAKLPSTVSSKRGIRIFALSVVTRILEYLSIEHAFEKVFPNFTPRKDTETTVDVDMGTKFFLKKATNAQTAARKYRVTTFINRKETEYTHVPLVTDYINKQWARFILQNQEIKCSTELRVAAGCDGVRILRCNRSYMDKPYFDFVWVPYLALKTTLDREYPRKKHLTTPGGCIPCQLACVVIGLGDQQVQKVVVRPCVDFVDDNNKEHNSVLLRRWRKVYGMGFGAEKGYPLFAVIDVHHIKGQVYCFEDFPTQFGTLEAFEKERKAFMDRYCLLEYARDNFEYGTYYVKHDWVYSVANKKDWPSLFVDVTTMPTEENDADIYAPPDRPI